MVNEYIISVIGSVFITNYGLFAALAVVAVSVCFYVLNQLSGVEGGRYVIPSLLLPVLGAIYIILRNLSGELIGDIEFTSLQLAAMPVQVGIAAISAALRQDSVWRAADAMLISAALGKAIFSLSDPVEISSAEFVVYFLIFVILGVSFYLRHVNKRIRCGNITLLGFVMFSAAGFIFGKMSACGIWVLGCVNLGRILQCAAAVVSAAIIIINGMSRYGSKAAAIHGGICSAMWLVAVFCDMSMNEFIAEHSPFIMGMCLLIMCADVYYCGLSKNAVKSMSGQTRANSEKNPEKKALCRSQTSGSNTKSARQHGSSSSMIQGKNSKNSHRTE